MKPIRELTVVLLVVCSILVCGCDGGGGGDTADIQEGDTNEDLPEILGPEATCTAGDSRVKVSIRYDVANTVGPMSSAATTFTYPRATGGQMQLVIQGYVANPAPVVMELSERYPAPAQPGGTCTCDVHIEARNKENDQAVANGHGTGHIGGLPFYLAFAPAP